MKSLIRKDLYNLLKNIKMIVFLLLMFTVIFLGVDAVVSFYISMFGLIFSMQIVTTFSFDEMTHWSTFAMAMPFSRRDFVRAKYVLHLLLTIGGIIAATLLSILGLVFHQQVTAVNVQNLLLTAGAVLVMAMVFGGISILLILRFSAERARLISIFLLVIPITIGNSVIYGIEDANVVKVNAGSMLLIMCGILAAAVLLELLMYRISCCVFAKKDLT